MADRPRLAFDALPGGRPCQAGTRLGRYELIARIGAGGMAEVWIARHGGNAGFSKLVAVKTILPHLASVEEARRMLFDEARVAARIHHPNVVSIQELGEAEGIPYVVMDWVDGLSLDRIVGVLSPLHATYAARIVADAALGLHAAHELIDDAGRPLHVVHRDISPFNIIIGRMGTVQVADFGIVKSRGQLHRTTALGEVRGRIAYMAPEQMTGQPVDRRADVFALGATLHEILTGELAFDGDNDAQIIYQITDRGYVPPPEDEQGDARGLFEIVTRALQRSPDDRFQTADEMHLALEGWLAAHAPPVITSSSIAELVKERVGVELEQREAQLRAALSVKRVTQPRLQLTLQGVSDVPAAALPPRVSAARSYGFGFAALAIALGVGGWVSFAQSAKPGRGVAPPPSAPVALDAVASAVTAMPSGAVPPTGAVPVPVALPAPVAAPVPVAVPAPVAAPVPSALIPSVEPAAAGEAVSRRRAAPAPKALPKRQEPPASKKARGLPTGEDEIPANPY